MPFTILIQDEKKQTIIRYVMLGVTTLSFIFISVAAFGCDFLKFESSFSSDTGHAGFFAGKVSGSGCAAYDDLGDADGAFDAGRAFACLAFICITLIMLAFYAIVFFLQKAADKLWLAIRVGYCVTLFNNFIMFSAFGTDSCIEHQDVPGYDCTPGSGAILAILNIFLLIGLIVMSFMIPAPKKSMCRCVEGGDETPAAPDKPASDSSNESEDAERTETVEETTEKLSGGRIRTRRITTHADGSKTIHETIQEAEIVAEQETVADAESAQETVEETVEEGDDGLIRIRRVAIHADGSKTITEIVQDAGTVIE